MRLTKEIMKSNSPDNFKPFAPKVYELLSSDLATITLALNKLGQLEDIGDGLGIDLITLFKALTQGAWFKNVWKPSKNETRYVERLLIYADLKRNCFDLRMDMFVYYPEYSTGGCFFYFKDYGKTWALTKEELL